MQEKKTEKSPEKDEKAEKKRQEEKSSGQACRTYAVWDNWRYTFRYLRKKEGTKAFAVCGSHAVLSILLPFLEAALAGAVAACLVSGRKPEEILLLVAGYIFLLQMVRLLQGHLDELRHKTLFLFRVGMMEELYRKVLEMDGQSFESALGRKKWAAAQKNLYMGNDFGIEAYARSFWDMLLNLCGLIIYGVIVGNASLLLLLLLTAQTLMASALHAFAGKRAFEMEEELDRHWAGLSYLRRESIVSGNGKDIRIYRMNRWFLRVFHELIEKVCAVIDRQQTGYTAAGIAEKLLTFVRNVIIYGWLIREMATGNLALAAFLLYVGIVAGFGTWMSGLFDAVQKMMQNEKTMDEYRDFEDFGIVEEGKDSPEHMGRAHELRLENVSFRYEGNAEDTIRNLNLTIRAGEKLALVGLNGAGKTTLIKLLCGLYRPTGGRIYLDGRDMRELSQKEIFREFAVVFQDVFAFSFPLVENVSCAGEGEEDMSRMRESLEKAGLWERVQELPKKERTAMNQDLDEKGVTLSGGELQKLMLARALYKDAPMVILDEPTAAMDPIAESEMYEKYDEMIQDKTAIFISHRLSSTRFCDRILFMENGCVIQEGSHEGLMEKGGAYADLFALQARYYKKEIATGNHEKQYAAR